MTEKNIHLVPEDSAKSIAIHFNPSVFFDAANSSNHSPFSSLLNGNNSIKNLTVVNDRYGTPAIYVINFTNNKRVLICLCRLSIKAGSCLYEYGEFKKDTVPAGILQWAEKTINNIEIVRTGLYDNSDTATIEWESYPISKQ
ncbi:MAG: hypothetical protein WDM71_08440 [Ferruginibacter sp.]